MPPQICNSEPITACMVEGAISSESLEYMIRDIMSPIIPADAEVEIVQLHQQSLTTKMTPLEHLLKAGTRCTLCAFLRSAEFECSEVEVKGKVCDHMRPTAISDDFYVKDLDKEVGSIELLRRRARARSSPHTAIQQETDSDIIRADTNQERRRRVSDGAVSVQPLRRTASHVLEVDNQPRKSIEDHMMKKNKRLTRACSMGQALNINDSGLDLNQHPVGTLNQTMCQVPQHAHHHRNSLLKRVLGKVGFFDGKRFPNVRRNSVHGDILT